MRTHRADRLVALALAAGAAFSACRRPVPAVAPARAPVEEYCWWHTRSSPLPSDSVAAHFAGAFTALGMSGATWMHHADTAWAYADVTRLSRDSSGAGYGSRVVAYQKGDSTRYRYYVTVAEPEGGPALSPDTASDATRRRIGICSDIARIAAVHGSPSQDPAGDEDLALWSRHPGPSREEP